MVCIHSPIFFNSLEELFQERGFSKDSEHKIDQVRLKTEVRVILFLLFNNSFIQYNSEFHLTERDNVYDGVYGKYWQAHTGQGAPRFTVGEGTGQLQGR